jgi:tRNA 2-selenouridine synthase
MAIQRVNADEFLALAASVPVADVRSPGEYSHAHIPGAHTLPLFSNEERRLIGTAYKQESREKAIKIGLEFFGKKMVTLVEEAERITGVSGGSSREIAVHCWRGGMRSGAVTWLLDLYGFKVYTLAGGYKSYRRHVLELFKKPWKLNILGGYTGGNKTGIIQCMIKSKVRAIDLEELAEHKGSAFGNLELAQQPSQEQFENLLADKLRRLSESDEPVWLEAESQRIGLINIPNDFFLQMRSSPLWFLDIPFHERLAHIVNGYGKYSKEKLMNAILRIGKKLGGLESKNAVNCLLDDDVPGCFTILLKYYDKLYLKTVRYPSEKNNTGPKVPHRHIVYVESDVTEAMTNMKKILEHAI